MKAISIDPYNRTVSSVLIPSPERSLQGMADYIGCRMIDIYKVAPRLVLVIDDEGLLVDRDAQSYWRLKTQTQPPLYGGRGLLVRCDILPDGEMIFHDADVPCADIALYVEWLDPPSERELLEINTPELIRRKL